MNKRKRVALHKMRAKLKKQKDRKKTAK